MANVKISALTAVTAPATTDVVPIVNAGATKKVTIANLVTAAVGTLSAWVAWTPTWTNLTVGNGTVTARYFQIGKYVSASLSLVFGTSTSISGVVKFSLPVTSVSYPGTATAQPLGNGVYYDVGGLLCFGSVMWASTTTTQLDVAITSATYATADPVTATVPFTWGNLDQLHCEFFYEAA